MRAFECNGAQVIWTKKYSRTWNIKSSLEENVHT